MSDSNLSVGPTPAPAWFWIVSVIALLWNLLGLMAFVAQMMMTEEAMQSLPPEQQEIYASLPQWITVFFAMAVFGGTFGCIALLMRSRVAVVLLAISLIGVIVQYGHMFFFTDTPAVMGAANMVLPVLVVLVSIALVPYALFCNQKKLLR